MSLVEVVYISLQAEYSCLLIRYNQLIFSDNKADLLDTEIK